MAELEVSERTVHRLRETLELAGVPVTFSKEENSYRVRPDFRFPSLHLTEDEAVGQATATAFSESEALHIPNGAKSTTRKLGGTSNEAVRRILEDVTSLTQVLDLKIADHPRQQETIRTAQWALVRRNLLTGRYRSPYESAPVTLTLHPYRLALIKQAWYLIARPEDEAQPRTFRVVRFQSLKLMDRPATIPENFDLKSHLGNAWSVYRGGKSYDIELRFSADAADTVLETTWHPTQGAKKHENGEVTLTFTVDGLNEILRWVVGWAGRVRVVKPTELRALVLDQHRKAIAKNEPEN